MTVGVVWMAVGAVEGSLLSMICLVLLEFAIDGLLEISVEVM